MSTPATHIRNYNLNQISHAVDATDSSDFHQSSFALKRTKSMGLFDEFLPQDSETTNSSSINNETSVPTDVKPTNFIPNDTKSPTISIASYDSAGTCLKQSPSSSPCSFTSQDSLETPDMLPIHDDSNLQHEPSRHVDYLSHNWKESDISTCWRNIVSHRRDVSNSVRLENASWRTWTKAKYGLRTIAPELVNWSKDCDVTWLYGPLYNPPANVYSHEHILHSSSSHKNMVKAAAAAAAKTNGFKPILKKHQNKIFSTPVDLAGDSQNSQADVEPTQVSKSKKKFSECDAKYVSTYLRHHNYRHRPHTGQSDEKISQQINLQYSRSDLLLRKPQISSSRLKFGKKPSQQPKERHIHFNNRVEQCIAVEENSSDSESILSSMSSDNDDYIQRQRSSPHKNRLVFRSSDRSEDDSEEDSDEDDNEPGLFLMLRSNSTTSLHGRPGLSKLKSASMSDIPHSIAPLPATTLKSGIDEEEEEEHEKHGQNMIYSMMATNQRRKHNHYVGYDYNSIYEDHNMHTVAAINPKEIALPSSILNNPEELVEMPTHLLGKIYASGDVMLPPVLTVEYQPTPEPVQQQQPDAFNKTNRISSNSTSSNTISEKCDGEDTIMDDTAITRAVRSAKELVSHSIWAWK